jgi:conjugal transfer pilus assembly protein TraK
MTAVPAQALQLVEASDGVSVEAILSIKEPTRIRIEGAPITDVFGNIHSSQCGMAAALPATPGMTPAPVPVHRRSIRPARSCWTCDRDKGEIYVRPVGDSAKPINLFVASANATYTLLLRRSDTPADTIVIRDRTPKALKHATSAQAGPARHPTRYGR